MNTNLRRSVVALAASLACLAALATPASAVTDDHTATITSGTVTGVNGTTTFTSTIGSTGTGCTTSITVRADHSAGTADVTAFTKVGRFMFNGSHYVTVITRVSSTPGSASGGAIGATPVLITLRLQIYAQTGNTSTGTDCTGAATTPVCTLRVNNIGFTGAYDATTSHDGSFSPGATFTASGTGTIGNQVGSTCTAPFNGMVGGTATITLAGAL